MVKRHYQQFGSSVCRKQYMDYSASQTRKHITAVSGKTQKLTAAVHKTESLGSAAINKHNYFIKQL